MTRILLIDDEQPIRTICRSYLSEIDNIVIVGEADNIDDAQLLIKACEPDIILLDIHLGKNNGFDLLSRFTNPAFSIIFITAYEQYALAALKAGALDYLLKPIDENDFKAAIEKAKNAQKTNSENIEIAQSSFYQKKVERITLSAHDGYHIVWVNDIMYCHASGSYTTFHLSNGKKIIISKVIKEYEMILPSFFIRVHQSYLVNMNYVEHFSKDLQLILKNKEEIMVSTRKKEDVLNWIKNTK